MTDNPDMSPGQLDLVPPDLDQQHAAATAELGRLEALQIERRGLVLDQLRAAAITNRNAGTELDDAVTSARGAGLTWQQVADAVGLTRQAAWERWAR